MHLSCFFFKHINVFKAGSVEFHPFLVASLFHSICLFVSVLSFPPIHPSYHIITLGWSVCPFHFSFASMFVHCLHCLLSICLSMINAPWRTDLTEVGRGNTFISSTLSYIWRFYLGPTCPFGRIPYRQSMSLWLSYVLLLADLLFGTNSRFSFYPYHWLQYLDYF